MNLPLVIANWKMNLPSFNDVEITWVNTPARQWFSEFYPILDDSLGSITDPFEPHYLLNAGVAPPLTDFREAANHSFYHEKTKKLAGVRQIYLGFQDVSPKRSGSRTGELSATMLENCIDSSYGKAQYFCIIGHSERREFHNETDEIISEKLRRLLETDIIPVVCIGETLKDFEKGLTKEVLKNQIDVIFNSLESDKNIIIAYEPVWAIGSGKPAAPTDVNEIHKFIKDTVQSCAKIIDINVLYGGSVNAENSKSFFEQKYIDGALVGGASLDPVEFGKICINHIHQMETQ